MLRLETRMAIDPDFLLTFDWSKTSLGPIEQWPQTLKGYVAMVLALPTPAIIFWGSDQTQIYNDGYAQIMGPRHPRYFGGTFEECWPETHPIIFPWMQVVLAGGKPAAVAQAPIMMTRHGFNEEAFFTFTLSPLRDDDGQIRGVYQPVLELTASVLAARRAETLRRLAGRGDFVERASRAFDANVEDIPLAAIFVWQAQTFRAESIAGFASEELGDQWLRSLSDATRRVLETNTSALVDDVTRIVTRPWPEPVRSVFLTPLRRSAEDEPAGVIAFGVSPRLRFDDAYREFFEAIAREADTSFAARRAENAKKGWLEWEQAARREAEVAKDAIARRLSRVFEHAPVGIAVLRGPDHVFEVANPEYAALVSNRPILGLPLREALPELVGQGIVEILGRVYETREPYLGRSIRLLMDPGDGQPVERFFDFVYESVPGDDGRTDSIVVVVFEVTELAVARRDAESASRMKDEFFALLGHELRNPLSPITTALEVMRMHGDATHAKERTIIERQVAHITRLLDDLLDVSRITRGKVALRREPVELANVIGKAIEMSSPLFEQRHLHLEVHVDAEGLVVDGDPVRLAQVVANLLTNAAKYTEPGGHVDVSAERSGGRVSLRVQDTGIGIAKEMLARVFEPFTQEQQALDRGQGGLGLGLTIVSNLVQLHGGSVSAESAGPGAGSTFTVLLPTTDAVVPESSSDVTGPQRASRPRATRSLRVLVVDDNEDAAEMLAEALAMLGYETRVAHDGAATLRVAVEFAPDVALLDIGLPVMDGYELATRLRRAEGGDKVRLVALTGYGQASDKRRATEAGFDAHLVKPVQLDDVTSLIRHYEEGASRRPDSESA